MKEKLAHIKAYAQKNPAIAFMIVLVILTLLFGIIAMANSGKSTYEEGEDTANITPTEADEDETERRSIDYLDDEDEETEDTEEEEDTTPTAKPTKTTDTTATPAPSNTPTPAEKKVNMNLLGDIYDDKNCNAKRDTDEGVITASQTVNIFKMPGTVAYSSVTSNDKGHYSYSSTIKDDEKLSLQPAAVAGSGYKVNQNFTAPTIEFTKDNPTGRVDIPFISNGTTCP